MSSFMPNLEGIVQAYLQDAEFQQQRQQFVYKRNAQTLLYQNLIENFTYGNLTLIEFRAKLDRQLRNDTCWGSGRWHFMQQINYFVSFHASHIADAEGALKTILTGLNAANLGERIQQFYQRIELDRKKLLSLPNADTRRMASPKSAAFIISLFAYWLDPKNRPYIYYYSMRSGLALLLQEKLIPKPVDIHISKGDIEIKSANDHATVKTVLDGLAATAPKLKTDPYWADMFLSWVQEQAKKEANFFKNTYIFVEEEPEEPESPSLLDLEATTSLSFADPENLLPLQKIDDERLQPTPEPLLTQLITELRRHILIEERLVRDIYHALLGGHLILTGPPGTGKTELARLIPEILWQSEEILEADNTTKRLTTRTAYTTTLVTATSDWSTRTLISSIMPIVREEKVSYQTQYGHLIQAILRNWSADPSLPERWEDAQRIRLQAKSLLNGQQKETFHGHWLIIDEFNRASIDVALGEALTALSTGEALQLLVGGKPIQLPLPKDFRIIGTLNSFDRHYLNHISEALKRRFTFVEILPPSRTQRTAEQAMVLYKALKDTAHINKNIDISPNGAIWSRVVKIVPDTSGIYKAYWSNPDHPLHTVFYEIAWPLFEVIRIYRQLGTAQAIALIRQILIRGILEQYSTQAQWQEALDIALNNVLANQLQVILPDEIDVLLWHLKLEKSAFISRYLRFLSEISTKRRRLAAHLEALHQLKNSLGEPLLSAEIVENLLEQEEDLTQILPEVLTPELLTEAFHLDHPPYTLPQFTRRLRTFKAEQGL